MITRFHNNVELDFFQKATFKLISGKKFFFSPLVYFPDRAHDDFDMTTKESAILVTTLGATHIIARPLLGLLGTRESSVYGKQIVYGGASMLASLACFVSIWFDTMATQVLFVVVFGIATGR